jgi:hypothetical protein
MANGHSSPSSTESPSNLRLPRPMYPTATASATSPLGSNRYSPYSIPNHQGNPNSTSARSSLNRSPGSPDSLRDENIS